MKRLAFALIALVALSGCEVIGSQLLIPLIAEKDNLSTQELNLRAIELIGEANGRTRNRVKATASIQ